MTPQRCLLPSILSRVTASVQAALQNVTKVPLLLPWTHEHHRAEHEAPPGNQPQRAQFATITPEERFQASGMPGDGRGQRPHRRHPPGQGRSCWNGGEPECGLSEALALEARDPAPGFGPPHPGIQAGQGTKGPGGPGPSGTADGLDRGHKFRDRRPGEADWGVPGDGLEVGAAGGPPGHRGWPNPPESCRWNSHVESQFARNMLLNGIPLNFLSWWFGRGQIQTTATPANNTSHQARSPKWSFS